MNQVWFLRVLTVAFVVLIFHLAIAPDVQVAGVATELPVGLAIAAGLTGGVERGAVFGFAFGFVVDLFLFTPIGLSALVFGVAGWVAGHVFMDRIEESPVASALAIGIGTALSLGAFVIIGLGLGEATLRELPIARILVITSLVNAVAAFVLMYAAHWMWAVDPLRSRGLGR